MTEVTCATDLFAIYFDSSTTLFFNSYDEAKFKLRNFKFKCSEDYRKHHRNGLIPFDVPFVPLMYEPVARILCMAKPIPPADCEI